MYIHSPSINHSIKQLCKMTISMALASTERLWGDSLCVKTRTDSFESWPGIEGGAVCKALQHTFLSLFGPRKAKASVVVWKRSPLKAPTFERLVPGCCVVRRGWEPAGGRGRQRKLESLSLPHFPFTVSALCVQVKLRPCVFLLQLSAAMPPQPARTPFLEP